MADLSIQDLVVELLQRRLCSPSDQRAEPRRGGGVAGDPARPQRLRQDDVAVLPWRHSTAEVRKSGHLNHVRSQILMILHGVG